MRLCYGGVGKNKVGPVRGPTPLQSQGAVVPAALRLLCAEWHAVALHPTQEVVVVRKWDWHGRPAVQTSSITVSDRRRVHFLL